MIISITFGGHASENRVSNDVRCLTTGIVCGVIAATISYKFYDRYKRRYKEEIVDFARPCALVAATLLPVATVVKYFGMEGAKALPLIAAAGVSNCIYSVFSTPRNDPKRVARAIIGAFLGVNISLYGGLVLNEYLRQSPTTIGLEAVGGLLGIATALKAQKEIERINFLAQPNVCTICHDKDQDLYKKCNQDVRNLLYHCDKKQCICKICLVQYITINKFREWDCPVRGQESSDKECQLKDYDGDVVTLQSLS